MITIRPVSDLRNRFKEIDKTVKSGTPVYLTKSGYGTMVVMSLEQYTVLTEDIEERLDEADRMAEIILERYCSDDVFARVNERIKDNERL